MYYISEKAVQDIVTQQAVTKAVEGAFKALAQDRAECWPIVRETLGYADATFGFKSGFDRSLPAMGIKAGGLWPGNAAKGLANHQSTVVLFDLETGAPKALVRATYLTALRTAAASALSIRHLAREDARTLGIIGAGGQGEWQVRAALAERSLEKVMIFDAKAESALALAACIAQLGVETSVTSAEDLARASDVIITITPARAPVLMGEWVKPGTHIAAMGSDTVGKQELTVDLVSSAALFGDVAEQAISLGECQHAFAAGNIKSEDITCMGDVLLGQHDGRKSEEEITVFDSTGMALQDLASCELALQLALEREVALELD